MRSRRWDITRSIPALRLPLHRGRDLGEHGADPRELAPLSRLRVRSFSSIANPAGTTSKPRISRQPVEGEKITNRFDGCQPISSPRPTKPTFPVGNRSIC